MYCHSSKKLKSIPNFKNLVELNCSQNSITEIPHFDNLEKLICNYTLITKIPKIDSLKYLDCCGTKINKIPKLNNLEKLNCFGCKLLKSLPKIDSLKELNCHETNIFKLPNFKNLKILDCRKTMIIDIPNIGNIVDLSTNGCPWIKPNIKSFHNFEFDYVCELYMIRCNKVIRLQKWFKNYILSKKILNTIPNIINDLYSIEGFYGQLARKEFYELC